MSGAEAIALISILSSTLQLVDYTCQALARIKECRDHSTHLPKAFWNLLNQLPLISHALEITNNQVESGELTESACKALVPVIDDCQREIAKLSKTLKSVSPTEGEPEWKKNLKAVTSIFHDKDVRHIADALSQSLTVINQYHGAYTAATTGTILKKLTAAVATISDANEAEDETSVRHFMVPTVWSDEFTGRRETMARLEGIMADNGKHRRAAIIGLGGVGKTRVMLQYAYQFKDSEVHSVFWLHASSLSRVNKTCLEIAKHAKITGWEDPKSNKLELVKEWLEHPRSGKWLLLVDNADDFDLMFGSGHLAKSLPRSNNGAILLTTRDARVGMEFAKLARITLGALTTSESVELLENRLGSGENEASDLAELGDELCGIPLALVQASSFINENFLSISSYLELYRASEMDKIELLSEDFDDEIRDSEIRNPVATTWSLSFDYIQKRDPLAAEILSLMSMLDCQAIPESLIRSGNSGLKFSKALGTLQAFSLITARTDGPVWEGKRERSFDLHRLVKVAMRSWLRHHGELESYTAKALATMAERFTDGEWETRGKWSTYLPHAAVLLASDHLLGLGDALEADAVTHDLDAGILSHIPEGSICPVCAASLLAILSTCYYTTGKPLISMEEAEKAHRLRQKFLGKHHLDTLATLDLIAKPAKDLYLFPKAVEACKLAIEGKTKTLGPDHPSTLRSMAYLGITYRPMGKLEEAKEAGMHALNRRRVVLGNSHPDTLISMNYVGTVLRAMGDYEAAVNLETEKLQGWTKLQGPSHPQSLEAMAGLAWAYACQGNYTQAARLASHSLNSQLEVQGPAYYFTLWTMSIMAVILGMQGKYLEAEELCDRVLSLRTQYMGASHPFVYVSKLYQAWLYNETGRYDAAETLEREVLDFQNTFYQSATHHEVLLTKSQLASTYVFQGRHHEALALKREILSTRQTHTGSMHPVTLRCRSTLGMTLAELGDFSEASTLLLSSRSAQTSHLGATHPETLTTTSRLARLYELQGQRAQAGELYAESYAASVTALGEKHPRTIKRAEDLARFEHVRRSSEPGVVLSRPLVGRELSSRVVKLTLVEESEVDKLKDDVQSSGHGPPPYSPS